MVIKFNHLKMSERLRRNQPNLNSLRRMNREARKSYLKRCNQEFIDCLCECSKNLLKGNVPVSTAQFKKLKPYKKVLRKLSNNKVSCEHRRKLLVRQTGSGFLPALIGPLIALAASLFAN